MNNIGNRNNNLTVSNTASENGVEKQYFSKKSD